MSLWLLTIIFAPSIGMTVALEWRAALAAFCISVLACLVVLYSLPLGIAVWALGPVVGVYLVFKRACRVEVERQRRAGIVRAGPY